MQFENFVGPSYQSWSANVGNERAINLYAELAGSDGAKSKFAYFSTPGLQTFTTLPLSPIRGLWAGEERLFAAAGTGFYEVFADGSYNNRGTIADDADHSPVEIWPNGVQLLIVSAGHAYIDQGDLPGGGGGVFEPLVANGAGTVNVSGTAVTWVSGDKFDATMAQDGNIINIDGVPYTVDAFVDETHLTLEAGPASPLTGVAYDAAYTLKARTGTFLDSYFIVNPPDSKLFDFLGSDKGTEWDQTEVSAKEAYPDNIAAIYSDHEELWLFGTHWSTEVWRNEGDADAAGGFRRDPGGFIHCGLVAPWSVASLASGLHFLGGDTRGRTVAYRAQGFQPVRVSTHAVEQIWSKYTRVSDAYAYAYVEEGHQFWVLNFITANATWVYDVSTQMWHERAWWNGTSFEKHRGRCHAFTFGKHFIGDHTNGKIYQMSHNFYDDFGGQIRRERWAPHIANEQRYVFHHRIYLDLEITGSAPSVTFDWSDDDGTTWSAAKTRTPVPSGKKGRVIVNRLGSSRDRIYRVATSDAVKVAITDAYLDVSPGYS